MTLPHLSAEELDVLRLLIDGGPSRTIARPVRGRLALYDLIDETPDGWVITEKGKAVLDQGIEPPSGSTGGDPRAPRPGRSGRVKRVGPW